MSGSRSIVARIGGWARRVGWRGWLVAALLVSIGATQVARHGDTAAPLRWDQGAHLWAGLRPALALLGAHPIDALGMLWSLERWPPLFGLLELPLFFVFGPSALGPLLLVAGAWCLASWSVRGCAREVAGSPAAWLALAVALASPTWLGYAGSVMTETAGAAAVGLVLLGALRGNPWLAVAASSAALMLNYRYGPPLFAVAAITTVVHHARWRSFAAAWLLCAVLPLGIWFASPGKLHNFTQLARNDPTLAAATPWEGVLNYAPFLASAAGCGAIAGVLVCLLALVGAVRRGRRVWPVVVYIALASAMLVVHPNQQARYVYPLLPALFVLAGCGLADLAPRRSRATLPAIVVLAAAVGLLHPTSSLLPRQDSLPPASGPLFDALLDEARAPLTIFVGAQAAAPPETIRWQIALRSTPPAPYVLVDPPADFALADAAAVVALEIDPAGPAAGELDDYVAGWRQRVAQGLRERSDLRLHHQRWIEGTGTWLRVYVPVVPAVPDLPDEGGAQL